MTAPYGQLPYEELKGKLIGIEEAYYFQNIDADVANTVKQAIQTRAALVARIEPVKILSLQYAEYANNITLISKTARIYERNLVERSDDFDPSSRASFLLGKMVSATQYIEAQQIRRRMAQEFEHVWKKVDLLVAPTLLIVAHSIGESFVTINDQLNPSSNAFIRYNIPANLLGLPADFCTVWPE